MAEPQFKSFAEFWPHYVGEHSRPATRTLHAAGTLASVSLIAGLVARRKWKFLPLALVPGYGLSWLGHYLIERNRPATYGHPAWSLAADFKMVGLILAGRMGPEIERARAQAQASASNNKS